jgi:hypothetical protein
MSLSRETLEKALANLMVLHQKVDIENKILREELNEYKAKEIAAAWAGMNATVSDMKKVISMMEGHLEVKDG